MKAFGQTVSKIQVLKAKKNIKYYKFIYYNSHNLNFLYNGFSKDNFAYDKAMIVFGKYFIMFFLSWVILYYILKYVQTKMKTLKFQFYLLSPMLIASNVGGNGNGYIINENYFYPAVLPWVFYFIEKGNFKALWIFCILTLFVKEDVYYISNRQSIEQIDNALERIPENASVTASAGFSTKLTNREGLYIFYNSKCEYAAVDLRNLGKKDKECVKELLTGNQYGVYEYKKNLYLILRKNYLTEKNNLVYLEQFK